MNWMINLLIKEARARRFQSNDRVRFFTEQRKGTGRNIVLTPKFQKGTILDYKPDTRRYVIKNDSGETFEIHPRNAMPESISRKQEQNSITDVSPTNDEPMDDIII